MHHALLFDITLFTNDYIILYMYMCVQCKKINSISSCVHSVYFSEHSDNDVGLHLAMCIRAFIAQ